MSALGHKQTCAVHQAMSALPPIATAKADITDASYALSPVEGRVGVTVAVISVRQPLRVPTFTQVKAVKVAGKPRQGVQPFF